MVTHKTLASFTNAIRNFQVETLEAFERLMRHLAFVALEGVVFETIVRTGRARGGWQISINNLPQNFDYSLVEKGAANMTSGAADAMGNEIVEKIKEIQLKKHGIGQIIYLVNNVEYISKVEAIHGMVNITFQRLKGAA